MTLSGIRAARAKTHKASKNKQCPDSMECIELWPAILTCQLLCHIFNPATEIFARFVMSL